MEHTVNLSEELIRDAHAMAEASGKSLSAQIELWAALGRSLEPFLDDDQIASLQRTSAGRLLSEAVREADTEQGRKRVRDHLEAGPFPRFEAVPSHPDLVRKIEADGTETIGKFVDRIFQAADS